MRKANKKIVSKLLYFLVIIFLSLHLFPSNTHAYIDPGSGSYLSQIILAAALSTIVMLKLYWRKVSNFFTRIFSKTKKDDDQKDSS